MVGSSPIDVVKVASNGGTGTTHIAVLLRITKCIKAKYITYSNQTSIRDARDRKIGTGHQNGLVFYKLHAKTNR